MAFDPKNVRLIGHITTRRRLSPELHRAVKKFSQPIGGMVWAWSYCHTAFSNLFSVIVARPDHAAIGRALWHVPPSDSMQRALLLAASEVVFAKRRGIRAGIKWAKIRADDLASARNDIIHMATAFENYPADPVVVPDQHSTLPNRYKRLSQKTLEKKIPELQGDLIALGGYVLSLSSHISFPGHHALPRRPKLRCVQPQDSRKGRRHRSKARLPLPQPSPS